jgi:hypothetical protein
MNHKIIGKSLKQNGPCNTNLSFPVLGKLRHFIIDVYTYVIERGGFSSEATCLHMLF